MVGVATVLVDVFKMGMYVLKIPSTAAVVVVFVGRLAIVYGYLVAVMKQIGYVKGASATAARVLVDTWP